MKILGIDLGTSNTYVYACFFDAQSGLNSVKMPVPVVTKPVSDDNGSIATVVLYENGQPLAIGNLAESEFNAHPSLQANRFLATQFKPEIAKKGSQALCWMKDFLVLLKAALPESFFYGELKIFVGIPSLAKEDFSLNLGGCFLDAGWPMPEFVRESDAAVVSCLQAGTLNINDMEHKSLILDFGGGTCDYTAIEGLDVLQNGGDSLYGGRLFDDLVFRRFLKEDKAFVSGIGSSPAAWFVHWVECREQKEEFSDFVSEQLKIKDIKIPGETVFLLRIAWIAANGAKNEAYANFSRQLFMQEAENYKATPELLAILAQYANTGGVSAEARDLLNGKEIALLTWMRRILESVDKKNLVRKIVLTGGSARWFFVKDLCQRLFPRAECVSSHRGFEDIAFGLALFPILLASREKVSKLLEEKLPAFTVEAVRIAQGIIARQIADMADLCSQRIVEKDILPALEKAKDITVGELEENFRQNIINDSMLQEIVRQKSDILNKRISEELGAAFRQWLVENGVLLVPLVEFPGKAIGNDFFLRASESLAEMDIVRLTRLALTTILPILVGTVAAHFLAPMGEPVSIATGIMLAGTTAWATVKGAPKFIENRKIPGFLLKDKYRKQIMDKNRKVIEKELERQFAAVQSGIEVEVEKKLTRSLEDMVGSLGILNQIETRQIAF